jgi:ATP-binding cassette, subfamily F, member 3
MPLINLARISKSYGAETILTAITLQLQPGEKAGLIGPNGSGKTTLLKIIAGEIEADEGTLHLARGTKIGYLPQEPHAIPAGTLRSHLEYPIRNIYALKDDIAVLEAQIAAGAEDKGVRLQEDLDRYAALTERFAEEGGYQVESRLNGVARGLGFTPTDLDRDISGFSGGEKTRARLAGLLLQDLDLLLLDEPTNFLDLTALEWLEKYLRDLRSALLVVSHDRFFLDRVASRIFALRGHQLKAYSGNYSAYQKKLESECLSTDREYKKQQLLKTREERLVREAKADERSKRQARSRQKRLDRLELVERLAPDKSFKPGLGYSGRSGRQVVIFDRVTKNFDQKNLFSDLSFEINWGDRIALIGPNGAGKSTLLKIISGSTRPTSGSIRLGPAVRVIYFDQEQEKLLPRQTLLETITAASELDLKEARNYLGRYLFRGDDVFKQVGDLSGGEKSRLALARLALSSGNCLLMDEPTSHLDLPALEELENVLAGYPGTLIVVSHDRYFLKGLANRVFELDGGTLRIFERSFAEYLALKDSAPAQPGKDHQEREEEKSKRRKEHQQRQAEQKKLRRLRDRQTKLEKKISETEAEISRLEKTLSTPALYGHGDHTRLAELGAALEEAKENLSGLMQQWEEITDKLENI